MKVIEQWKVFELSLTGPKNGNPYTDIDFSAIFSNSRDQVLVRGFYDGDGQYKVRFMPERLGEWHVMTQSNVASLNQMTADFICTAAEKGNHGPVRVSGKTHFAYADGTAYLPFGTTAYAWTVQPEAIQEQTLETLKANAFNKIRMTVFPKCYNYNLNEPEAYPYEGKPLKKLTKFDDDSWMLKPEEIGFDFSKFNPEYFQHLEHRIQQLDELGIQADLILFHPYDSWGFARMGKHFNKLYIEYIVARLASYKNVWWSLANEFDLMAMKGQIGLDEWDDIGRTVRSEDPSNHLLSIHNLYDPPAHKDSIKNWYDDTKPWITHLSVQTDELFFVPQWLEDFEKPVVIDEFQYEGNIEFGWGNNTPQKQMDSFYKVVLRGGYGTHGETYIDKPYTTRSIWWAHGGVLRGESPDRIAYLKQLLADNGFAYVKPLATTGPYWDLAVGASPDESHILAYLGSNQPEFESFNFLPKGVTYHAELIDTWNMTKKELGVSVTADRYFQVPQKPYQAVLLTREDASENE